MSRVISKPAMKNLASEFNNSSNLVQVAEYCTGFFFINSRQANFKLSLIKLDQVVRSQVLLAETKLASAKKR
jgi:ribosomal protein L33